MVKLETLFLKAAVILIGIPVLALCIFGLPRVTHRVAEIYPALAFWQYPALIGLYAAAAAFFFVLYQAFTLLRHIDKNKAFSESSVKALKNIKYSAITISILFAAGLPILYYIADVEDAPGILVIGLFFTFTAMVIAAFAALLQKLLRNAIADLNGKRT